jgi:hypothetical protein
MLCWETASDCQSRKTFCHRHLVAQWLEERLGIDAPEVTRGAVIAIPCGSIACPVEALRSWTTAAGITSGAVFRPVTKGQHVQTSRLTDRGLVQIIKRHATRVGLDPREFSGHGLRAGFLTSAAARGANIFRMADQSRHRSMEVVRGYVRSVELFKHHPGSGSL